MTIPRSGPQVKYELLEDNKRTAVKTSHLWLAILLVILITCSSIILLYATWEHMENAAKEKENIDFIMIGPKKPYTGQWWRSQRRGELYGLAEREMRETSNLSLPDLVPGPRRLVELGDFKRVCYYSLPGGSGAEPYTGLTPDMLDPELCTHILLAFATVTDGTIQPNNPDDLQIYKGVTDLKKKNPNLKVMLSVEWFTSEGELAYVVSNAKNRSRFADSAVQFLKDNSLDGLDVDWEFPSWPNMVQNQTSCYVELLHLLSNRLRQQQPPLLLSVAAGAPKPIIDRSYNITAMAQTIDFVNVMAYDYHMYQSYLPLTGANAPLYQRKAELGYFATLNTNWTASYWLYKGMPAEKLVIGIPTYGHSFTLTNENNHGWDAPSSGIGSTGLAGFLAYYEACSFMRSQNAHAIFDYESKVPYAYKEKEWISYENEQSVAYKAEYVKEHQFGGVMLFSLNMDDVLGVCDGKTRFPLIRRVMNVLQDDQL